MTTPTAPITDPPMACDSTVDAPPADVGVSDAATRNSGSRDIELAIEGMTCAACAMRIEKKLNKLPDVLASVNYATATARVTAPAALPTADLIAAVERAGYGATAPAIEPPGAGRGHGRRSGRGQARRLPAAPADRRARVLPAADRSVADAVAGSLPALPWLAMAAGGLRGTGGTVVRVAISPGRAEERPARLHHDGHPGVAGHHRGLRLVGLRHVRARSRGRRRKPLAAADPRLRGRHLSGDRRHGHHLPAGGPTVRGPRPADRRPGHARPRDRGCQGRMPA